MMELVINQKQSRDLLEEHAKSSFNFTFLGRNELFICFGYLLLGIIISVLNWDRKLMGLPFIVIGIIELIKYPGREQRWVKKKEKQIIFNKDIEFTISNESLKIIYDKETKIHKFRDMRGCLISETGILFKISWPEYYYISYKSLESDQVKEELLSTLEDGFEHKKLKIKQTHSKN